MKRIALFALALIATTSAHAAVTISNAKTKNMACTGGVCTPTGSNANLNVGDLQTKLASSYVIVRSNAAAPDIAVADPLTWASTHPLTLDAYQSIHVKAPVVVEGTSRLTLITNDGGIGGDYTFNASASGSITFWDTASHLVINGTRFKLVKYLATLANEIAADPYGNYALAASYDASRDGVYDNAPVRTTFFGTFEGIGNTLSNLAVTIPLDQGKTCASLFCDNRGLVRDISLVRARMSGPGAGAIATTNEGWIKHVSSLDGTMLGRSLAGGLVDVNGGEIESSSSSGSVRVQDGGAGGGLAAINSGTISFSDSAAVVEADPGFQASVGGIAGSNTGTIEFASASGNIAGQFAGGIAGASSETGSIGYCHSSGKVTVNPTGHRAAPKTAGGLVGGNSGSITQSYATGAVSAPKNNADRPARVGGLVGSDGNGMISYSYATGSVSGISVSAGGLAGVSNASAITQTYATGNIDAVPGPYGFVGGLIGDDTSDPGSNALDYWDLDTSGISNPHQGAGNIADDPGLTGLTNLRLKATLPAGFDPNVWGQNADINNGWPYLLGNPPQ